MTAHQTPDGGPAGLIPQMRRVPLFQGLPDAALERLAASARRRTYRPSVALFTQSDEGDKLYVILSGSVHIQRDTAQGRTVLLGVRGPGEHFGEMALLDDSPRMADALTAGECELLTLGRDAFRECVRTCPEIGLAVMTVLARRLREAADRLESRHELDVTGRLAECLLALARTDNPDRAPGADKSTPPARLRPRTHQQLAEMIGTTHESVTRALGDLRAIKAVRTEGRPTVIVLLNEKRLADRAAR